MPASMMMACVALRPNVTGNRMEMPASGPMPGKTPTNVPTRHPRNAYHRLVGSKATEKPCARLRRVVSTADLDSERACLERRLQQVDEENIGDRHDADTIYRRRKKLAPFNDNEQGEHEEDVGGEETQPLIKRGAYRGNCDDLGSVLCVEPWHRRKGFALASTQGEHESEEDHEHGDDFRQETRARQRQRADRQVAAQRDDQQADADEECASNVV